MYFRVLSSSMISDSRTYFMIAYADFLKESSSTETLPASLNFSCQFSSL